jgi:hypothetical protein
LSLRNIDFDDEAKVPSRPELEQQISEEESIAAGLASAPSGEDDPIGADSITKDRLVELNGKKYDISVLLRTLLAKPNLEYDPFNQPINLGELEGILLIEGFDLSTFQGIWSTVMTDSRFTDENHEELRDARYRIFYSLLQPDRKKYYPKSGNI